MKSIQKSVAAIGAAAAVATALAVSAPAAPGDRGARVAPNVCAHLQVKLGDRFATRFGSASDCEAKLVAAAQSALAACKGSENVKQCVKGNLRTAIKPAQKGGR